MERWRVRGAAARTAARCEIRSWTGDFDAILRAPDGSVAAVRWNDQTEAGLVLVEVAPDLRQLDAAWTRERRIGSRDRCGGQTRAGSWWSRTRKGLGRRGKSEKASTPTTRISRPAGRSRPDRSRPRSRSPRIVKGPVDVDLPRGWFPADDADRGLAAPRIESSGEVVLRVPAEGERYLELGTA